MFVIIFTSPLLPRSLTIHTPLELSVLFSEVINHNWGPAVTMIMFEHSHNSMQELPRTNLQPIWTNNKTTSSQFIK